MSEETMLRITPTRLNTTRQHRALSEHIFVRFPGLVRALNLLRLRLPIRSRLRRFLLLRLAAMGSAAVNRRDFDLLLTGFDPEIDLRAEAGAYPPGLVGHHHGHSGYRDVWSKMLEAFQDVKMEPEELIDTGDRVISVTRVNAHGAGSGVPVSMTFFQVFTFRAGLVIRQEDVQDRGEAFKAAGLSD
jgi:ketosteroid isomerase-like protein